MIAAQNLCVLCYIYRSYAVNFLPFCWCAHTNLMKSNKAIMHDQHPALLPMILSIATEMVSAPQASLYIRMVGDLCSTILMYTGCGGAGYILAANKESMLTCRQLPLFLASFTNAVSCMHRWLTMSGILSADIRTLHLEKNLLFLGVDERNATSPSKSQSLNVAFYRNARRVQMFRDCLCKSCVPMLTVQAHSASATT